MIDLLLHADEQLALWATDYGFIVYGILFLIIFAETGLVVTPFLPGDSLLFAAGALAATGALRLDLLLSVMAVAAVLGNVVNYAVGRQVAHRFFDDGHPPTRMDRFVKREYVRKAHDFFIRHGGKAVVLARFVPIVRTFLPFVAGGAQMPYRSFMFYNVTGCVLLVVLGIIGVSVLPIVYEVVRAYTKREASA
jgi:membrane-associated protein